MPATSSGTPTTAEAVRPKKAKARRSTSKPEKSQRAKSKPVDSKLPEVSSNSFATGIDADAVAVAPAVVATKQSVAGHHGKHGSITADGAGVSDRPVAAAELSEEERDGQEFAPRPVSAAQVTGIPIIPVPQGPIAGLPAIATSVKAPRTPKAGRDLPAAISVGVALLVLVIGSLLFYPVAFVALATIFVCVGVWEVNRAIAGKGIKAPFTPVFVGALAMPASAYFAGAEGLLFALVASAGATVLWRSLDPEPGAVKSILAGVFSLLWIPFLLSFVFLMLRGESGPTRGLTLDLSNINPGVVQVIIMLLLVVANDTFGYLVGVLFGKHPMAPRISPKKSWEGFAGSLGGATLVAIPATVFLLDQHWWVGFALAIGMVFAGTGGDFAESMVKRELGVKDMSNLLPGHGGVMDRLDSILFAAPVAYATFSVLGQF